MKVEGFEPIGASKATVLILGTLPGADSLKIREYYAIVGSENSDPSLSGNLGRSPALSSGSSRARRVAKRRPERGRGDRRHDST